MKKNIGLILGMSLAMQSCSRLKSTENTKCIESEWNKTDTYTHSYFKPNVINNEYRRKFLGVKNKKFKK